ncbi:hypothetical protein MMC18_006503 [Xylographa bjoerkii]|nr:hypothetical protein [Xylographa bjoerkii]
MSETDASEDSQISHERVLSSEAPQSPGPSQSRNLLHPEERPDSEEDFRHNESLSTSADPSSAVFRSNQQVTLQVGERRFTTTKETLACGSHYFARMLSGRWPYEVQEDGSYFIDADGVIFEHLLRYLRHGVLPVYYDSVKGHDFGLYVALLEQARFFGVDALEKWLNNKTYLKVVKMEHHAWLVDSINSVGQTVGGDVELEYHTSWITKRVYVCPRGIPVHRGNPDACGRACKNAQGDADDEYVKEHELKIVAIQKKTVFMQEMCFGE